ncbi:MAG: 30S ribosomal protein S6 [Tenericutes bacterium ADurb.Bin087]|nr:MAG: 30S ribosomal protein S6 [Tenericutes bacterium ADurb.Bin087]
MKKYEIMYILLADLSEEERKAEMEGLHQIITNLGGKIVDVDTEKWGLRDFAYPINELHKGYYVVVNVESDAAAIAEFERLSKLNKNVIRHLVIAK